MNDYITAEEAGRILGEKARAVIRMVEKGLLRGRVMVAREHVEAIALARRVRRESEQSSSVTSVVT